MLLQKYSTNPSSYVLAIGVFEVMTVSVRLVRQKEKEGEKGGGFRERALLSSPHFGTVGWEV